MSQKSVENHYLSLLLPAFREHADKPVFRPYIGKVDAWDTVTYRGLEQRLVVAQSHWKKALAHLQLKTLDIVGFWSVYLQPSKIIVMLKRSGSLAVRSQT